MEAGGGTRRNRVAKREKTRAFIFIFHFSIFTIRLSAIRLSAFGSRLSAFGFQLPASSFSLHLSGQDLQRKYPILDTGSSAIISSAHTVALKRLASDLPVSLGPSLSNMLEINCKSEKFARK